MSTQQKHAREREMERAIDKQKEIEHQIQVDIIMTFFAVTSIMRFMLPLFLPTAFTCILALTRYEVISNQTILQHIYVLSIMDVEYTIHTYKLNLYGTAHRSKDQTRADLACVHILQYYTRHPCPVYKRLICKYIALNFSAFFVCLCAHQTALVSFGDGV